MFMKNNCEVCLVLEYADTDLSDYIEKHIHTTKYDPLKLFFDVACGINELHSNNIIHRDLKPQNCLVKNGVAMVADLDCIISPTNNVSANEVTTLWWRAPEVFDEQSFSNKVDIWALGIILYQLYTGHPLIMTPDEDMMMEMIDTMIIRYKNNKLDPVDRKDIYDRLYSKIPDKILDFMFFMLEEDPNKRPTIQQVLSHPILSKYKCVVQTDIFYGVSDDPKLTDRELKYRKTSIEWLEEVCKSLGFSDAILFCAIDIFDRVFPSEVKKMQCYAITSIIIAIKIFSVYLNDNIKYFSYLTADACSVKDLLTIECLICRQLKFKLYRTTVYSMFPEKRDEIYRYLLKNPVPIELKRLMPKKIGLYNDENIELTQEEKNALTAMKRIGGKKVESQKENYGLYNNEDDELTQEELESLHAMKKL
jgi:serine/threonine protein kinase